MVQKHSHFRPWSCLWMLQVLWKLVSPEVECNWKDVAKQPLLGHL